MERTVTQSSAASTDGALFRFDRPSYQQMLDYADTQFGMFADHDEHISCLCGD